MLRFNLGHHIRLLLLVFFLDLSASCYAQIIQDYADTELAVYYNWHLVEDTTQMDTRFRNTLMELRIGDGHAIFAPPGQMWADSLFFYDQQTYIRTDLALNQPGQPWKPMSGTLESEYIFKNMPEGKNTFYNLGDYYEEEIEPQEWILGDSTRTILGYECHLAECDFRGRHWIAWYTPEIALPEGPWKLGGLPGLILEAYDSKRHYVYTATGMTTDTPGKVGIHIFKHREPIEVERKVYLQRKWREMNDHENSTRKRLENAGIIKKQDPRDKPKKIIYPYYDYQETDYPHTMKD